MYSRIIFFFSLMLLAIFPSLGQNISSTVNGSFESPATYALLQSRESETFSKHNYKNSNNIFIQQVGNRNYISTNTELTESMLKFSQMGDDNSIDFLALSRSATGTIEQVGNNNRSFDFAISQDQEISRNLTQNGNQLHFENYGSNSIGNKLEFRMNGDFNSVIVRNFK